MLAEAGETFTYNRRGEKVSQDKNRQANRLSDIVNDSDEGVKFIKASDTKDLFYAKKIHLKDKDNNLLYLLPKKDELGNTTYETTTEKIGDEGGKRAPKYRFVKKKLKTFSDEYANVKSKNIKKIFDNHLIQNKWLETSDNYDLIKKAIIKLDEDTEHASILLLVMVYYYLHILYYLNYNNDFRKFYNEKILKDVNIDLTVEADMIKLNNSFTDITKKIEKILKDDLEKLELLDNRIQQSGESRKETDLDNSSTATTNRSSRIFSEHAVFIVLKQIKDENNTILDNIEGRRLISQSSIRRILNDINQERETEKFIPFTKIRHKRKQKKIQPQDFSFLYCVALKTSIYPQLNTFKQIITNLYGSVTPVPKEKVDKEGEKTNKGVKKKADKYKSSTRYSQQTIPTRQFSQFEKDNL